MVKVVDAGGLIYYHGNKIMKADWARFNKYLYNYWRLQAAVICLGLVTVPLSLLNPYLAKLIIDKAYGNKDLKLFLILAVIGGSIFVINGLVNALADYLSKRVKCGVNFNMTKDMFRHLQGLPVRFFKDKSAGELIYKIINDIHSVSDFASATVPALATLLPRCLFILVIVFYLNWELALLATLLVPISCASPCIFQKWLREMTRRMIEKFEGIYERLHEVFVNIHLVKALRKEDYEIKRFEEKLSEKIDFELKNARLLGISNLSGSILNKVIGGVIALYGGYQVIQGTITLGSLTAVMIYLTQLLGLARSISGLYENVLTSSVSRKRLGEILDIAPGRRDTERSADHHITRGRIEFRDISFGYKSNELIMKGMSFSIEPSAKIALTGPSGCGKTTLLALILGLYEPANGSILLDEIDIRDIRLKCLKAQVGIALQEPFLWNDTVANNILYGAEGAGREDMLKAAALAGAHDFIMNLPEKYGSNSGDAACRISEGQKQRIAIARAVIGRPKILILDEAMSSLDSETEDKIIDNIKREFANSTIIAVSHRLSTIRKMDCVYFFEGPGRMVIGTHDGLLAQNRKYRDLLASQV
jgi:ABC-type bacteriocin/lantibiotic exporter with double-glycine peptidase domain